MSQEDLLTALVRVTRYPTPRCWAATTGAVRRGAGAPRGPCPTPTTSSSPRGTSRHRVRRTRPPRRRTSVADSGRTRWLTPARSPAARRRRPARGVPSSRSGPAIRSRSAPDTDRSDLVGHGQYRPTTAWRAHHDRGGQDRRGGGPARPRRTTSASRRSAKRVPAGLDLPHDAREVRVTLPKLPIPVRR